ncbi:MAG TPA: electron transfer flavoprotein subunit alpha/FixB family protein, partial [Blastocatellia bacterium]|nr:electron transfer flavoprotein subunit alpha/FixB family protein [Blastocatellia bacterium]
MMANGILVYIEQADGKINRASYEAVRAAQLIGAQTGREISAIVFGQGVGDIAAEVAAKKVKTVYTVESEWLKKYTADGHTHA